MDHPDGHVDAAADACERRGGGRTQIHALQDTVGQPKCAVMRQRIVAINPSCRVEVIEDFLTAESAEGILSRGYDAREGHWQRTRRPRRIAIETGLVGWRSGSNSELTSRTLERGQPWPRYDMVLDAVDFADHKAELIAYCCANRLPVVSTGGTGGSDNPLAIKMDDITDVEHNKLLAATRKRLRKSKGFPAGVPCVPLLALPRAPSPGSMRRPTLTR